MDDQLFNNLAGISSKEKVEFCNFIIMQRKLYYFSLLFLFSLSANGQFSLNGTAIELPNGCYQLTYNELDNSGSIWYENKISLDSSFVLLMDIFLGCEDAFGADGLVIGFQPISTSIGTGGGGIGFLGVAPSLGIEFDTWQNTPFSDPFFDHIAFIQDGILDHNNSNNLAGPVPISATTNDVEDCEYHELKVTWDAETKTIEVFFDCQWRLSYQGDIVNDIFNGDSEVFWGVTSATGGATNYHRVCFEYTSFLDQLQDQQICAGESVVLAAGAGSSYIWSPALGLSNPFIPNPIATPTSTTLYQVTITDDCGESYFDDVLVEVFPANFNLELGPDQEICEDISITLDASQNNASYLWNTGETSPTIAVQTSGNYSVTVTEPNSPCIAVDNVFINFPPIPQITLPNDSIICENTTFDITPISLSGNITWSTGSTGTTLSVSSPGTYFAETSNTCGADTDSITLTYVPQPIAQLPPDIEACVGQTVSMVPLEILGDQLWSTGSVAEEIIVTSTSTISLSANNECGTASDSVSVTFSEPPFVLLERPYLFCEGQSITIQALDWNGTLQWENNIIADSFTISQAGIYQVTALNACGEAIEVLEVIAEDCQRFYIPNAFSPNDDGFNDAFYFQDDGNILEIQTLLIFDRWGGLVFQRENFLANDPSLGWNGKKNGTTLPIGVYTFYTKVRTRDHILRKYKGDIHLIR